MSDNKSSSNSEDGNLLTVNDGTKKNELQCSKTFDSFLDTKNHFTVHLTFTK